MDARFKDKHPLELLLSMKHELQVFPGQVSISQKMFIYVYLIPQDRYSLHEIFNAKNIFHFMYNFLIVDIKTSSLVEHQLMIVPRFDIF